MRINEIHGWGSAQTVFPDILRKIAHDDPTLDKPEPEPKRKYISHYQKANKMVATWWPHHTKISQGAKDWLENDKEYLKNVESLRKKFIAGRAEGKEYERRVGSERGKPFILAPKGYGVQQFERQANQIMKNALKRYIPPEPTPKPTKDGKIRKPDRRTRRPMHLDLPT